LLNSSSAFSQFEKIASSYCHVADLPSTSAMVQVDTVVHRNRQSLERESERTSGGLVFGRLEKIFVVHTYDRRIASWKRLGFGGGGDRIQSGRGRVAIEYRVDEGGER
jgi:hypothetical protein